MTLTWESRVSDAHVVPFQPVGTTVHTLYASDNGTERRTSFVSLPTTPADLIASTKAAAERMMKAVFNGNQ